MVKQFDLVVRGGLLVEGRGIERADLGIQDGRVVAREPELDSSLAPEVIDARGFLVFPGLIDVHCHPVYLDDLEHLSRCAARGGITTLMHFAYALPGQGLVETVCNFRDEGKASSLLDFSLHAGIFAPSEQVPEIPRLFDLGVRSAKMFMAYAKLSWMTDDYWLMAAMDLIAKGDGLAMVHAENGLAVEYLEDRNSRAGVDPLHSFGAEHPPQLEAEAINRATLLAQISGCRLYIPHLSSRLGLQVVRRAREGGARVFAETCPQYLSLTEEVLQDWGARAKIGPPLRKEEDRLSLWQGLREGAIDVVASDHAPKAKAVDDDFRQAPFGSPQVESLLTVTYDEGVNQGRIGICRVVEVLSEAPAKIFGLYPRKGALDIGSDADLLIFDPVALHTIRGAEQYTKAGYTLYEGRTCLGRPRLSLQRGHLVLQEGEVLARAGQGLYLPQSPFASC